jgi:hypothetical protein
MITGHVTDGDDPEKHNPDVDLDKFLSADKDEKMCEEERQ